MAKKLTFLKALPDYARAVALEELTTLLQAKYGEKYALSEDDVTAYEAGTTQQPKEATDEEINKVLDLIM